MVIQYDSIRFLKDGMSLGITCLPDFSTKELRETLAKHIGAYQYDEMWFYRQNGTIEVFKLGDKITG